MEKIKITLDKTMEWLKAISTKSRIKEALNYEGISLWWFYEFELYYFVENYIKNQNDSKGTLKKDTHRLILRFAKYYVTSKAITRYFLGKLISKRIKNKTIRI